MHLEKLLYSRDMYFVTYAMYSPGLLEELSQSSEPLTQCLSVDTGQLIYQFRNLICSV